MSRKVKNSRNARPSDPIGVFDSGVGGLSVLAHLQKQMPHERFIFLADQAFVPYGAKSALQLKRRSARIVRFFLKRHTKAVVVACNTATVYALEHLRATFSIPFIGTVPAVKPACRESRRKIVAVLSTPATAKSPGLKQLIRHHANQCTVLRIGCPGLEEAVEHGSLHSERTRTLLQKYLKQAEAIKADRIVLGCTHYPFLKQTIRSILPVPTIDSGAAIAKHTRAILSAERLLRASGDGSSSYWTTGTPYRFSSVASFLLKQRVRARRATM